MEILFNDRSFHGQFRSRTEFESALARLMNMRCVARRFGREVHCHKALLDARPMQDMQMQQAVSQIDAGKQKAVKTWLYKGPFWDDGLRRHGPDDWLEREDNGEIVTESAAGEAAFRNLHGVDCGLVSVSPSDWNFSPVSIIWHQGESNSNPRTELKNWWEVNALESELQGREPSIQSWEKLRETAANRFERLVFAGDCFEPLLQGVPFGKSAAMRFFALFKILDQFAGAFDADGRRTDEGNRIYQECFTGDRGLFSDSSDKEKRRFKKELTFDHPENPGQSLYCTWHGKISHRTLRLHFSWPVQSGRPVYVVYAGPKITKL